MKKYKIKFEEFKVSDSFNRDFRICKPSMVYDIMKDKFNPFQEEMDLLIMNVKNNIIKRKTIAVGGHNQVLTCPADIFQYVLLASCNHFIICHNHPSGDLAASDSDVAFTKKLKKASEIMGMKFLDHIIYTAEGYVSLKQERVM